MDYEETKKRQRIRVLIAEIGMVIAVILIVTMATLAAMGFFISENGRIEQSGLMQIHSIPSGATVELDGTTLFARTNLSRTMSAGDHHIKISRAGYDEWEKTIHMYSGILIRLYYPRLFLQDRTPEKAMELVGKESEGLEFYEVSESRNYVIYAEKHASSWQLLDVRGDDIKVIKLEMTKVLPGMVEDANSPKKVANNNNTEKTYHFDGQIESMAWSRNEERILAKVKYQDKQEWVLVNLKNLEDSLNLTQTFGLNFEQIEMIDNAANKLYALENQQVRQINVTGRSMTKILLSNVEDFASNGANIIYVANSEQDGNQKKQRVIGVYRDGDDGGTILANVAESAQVKVALSRYMDEDYMCYFVDRKPTILYGAIPAYDAKSDALGELKTLANDLILSDVPDTLSLNSSNEYLVAQKGKKYMVIDLDRGELFEYVAPSANLRWLDDSMMYVSGGDGVEVWDFDGTNQRELVEASLDAEIGNATNNDVMITANNRWLYYLTKTKDSTINLVRERILD